MLSILHDVTAAILVYYNNKMAALLVHQSNPVTVELFSFANTLIYMAAGHTCQLKRSIGRHNRNVTN